MGCVELGRGANLMVIFLQVRELASSTFSGLLRCGYITDIEKLKVIYNVHAHP